MKKADRINLPVVSSLLYFLSFIFLFYTAWLCFDITADLRTAIDEGFFERGGDVYMIIANYMTYCGEYFVYTVLFASLAHIFQIIKRPPADVSDIDTEDTPGGVLLSKDEDDDTDADEDEEQDEDQDEEDDENDNEPA